MGKRRQSNSGTSSAPGDDDTEEIIELGDVIYWLKDGEVFMKEADALDVAKWGVDGTERS
ncbi:MAG: hypothetical protein CK520_01925 [Actinobacteria bacterium]|nr:MAG: hypothetical protein CK520_01925 [Actinomycetota bacterium]